MEEQTMFTIKVADNLHSFGKFNSKKEAADALTDLGWNASVITDGFYKDGFTASIIPYYEPYAIDVLRTLKPLTKDR